VNSGYPATVGRGMGPRAFFVSYESMAYPEWNAIKNSCFGWRCLQASAWLGIRVLDLNRNPMCAILDLGCAKPMGSRRAPIAFKRAARKYGIQCWGEPTRGKFTFADSRTNLVWSKMVVQFLTNPTVTTEFDIIEEGDVPILFSLGQMKNF